MTTTIPDLFAGWGVAFTATLALHGHFTRRAGIARLIPYLVSRCIPARPARYPEP